MSVKKDEQQNSSGTELESVQDFLTSQDARFLRGTPRFELLATQGASCELDTEGQCITCSDEALPAKILRIDSEAGLALVEVKDTTEEIDITLVDGVAPGDMVLVHGGVAIGLL